MTSWGSIGLGAVSAVAGAVLFGSAGVDGTNFGPIEMIGIVGLLLLAVGALMLQIGIIAEGVRVGSRR